jgi:uncharacterized protein YkwD
LQIARSADDDRQRLFKTRPVALDDFLHRHTAMRIQSAFALLLLSALTLASCSDRQVTPTSPVPGGSQPGDAEVAAFVDLVNAHRQSLGLDALVWDPTAAAVALAHSQDMVTRGYFSHISPEGETPFDRLRAAGIRFTMAGENIAFGFSSANAVFAAWMASPEHRANIEHTGYTHHGVGRYGTYWTHVFFTPRGP